MSVPVAPFSEEVVQGIAKVLGECGSGSDISRVVSSLGLTDGSGESTKWKRIYWLFLDSQRRHRSAKEVLAFARALLAPARFAGRSEEFESRRTELNTILAFVGIDYGADGAFRPRVAAKTLDEAEQRQRTIRAKFRGRVIHAEVLKYCRAELLQENYFHAVFEATKGLAQRIREMSGVSADGAGLVDQVLLGQQPMLAFNTLQTESERSEHKGVAALLKGCFAAVRNPLAHEPKILWDGEDDAADYLSLISLLHRRLDSCVPTAVRRTT